MSGISLGLYHLWLFTISQDCSKLSVLWRHLHRSTLSQKILALQILSQSPHDLSLCPKWLTSSSTNQKNLTYKANGINFLELYNLTSVNTFFSICRWYYWVFLPFWQSEYVLFFRLRISMTSHSLTPNMRQMKTKSRLH